MLRKAPNREYLEFALQPAPRVVYTDKEEIHKNTSRLNVKK